MSLWLRLNRSNRLNCLTNATTCNSVALLVEWLDMKKNFPLIVIMLVSAFVLSFGVTARYISQHKSPPTDPNTVSVVASFYPLYFFASSIGGPYASVTNITPAGSEPHEYEPSPQQIALISKSQMLILNGGLEPWGQKVKQNLAGKSVLILTSDQQFVQLQDESVKDPHIWLNPNLAKTQVSTILQGYQTIDPVHQAQYSTNAQSLLSKLSDLENEYKKGLQNCRQTEIVTSHAAFAYLASEYGFHLVSISGISPDQEPSPAQLAKIAQFVKEHKVKYIFFERLLSPKLSETIAQETGAQTMVLDPLEGLTEKDIQSGRDYFSVMRENLIALRTALECQ